MKKLILPLVAVFVLALAAGFVWYCWATPSIHVTQEARREARKSVVREMRRLADDAVVPFLEKTAAETHFEAEFPGSFPWFKPCFQTVVPLDFIAQMTEEAIVRFAGGEDPATVKTAQLREAIAFAARLSARCGEGAANSLRDRRLDGFFILKDYAAALALLEGPFPGHSEDWRKGTVAKIKAHRAMDAGDKKEAAAQLEIFGEFLNSKEMDNFEDCDPTTGVVYVKEWLVAKNLMRCAGYAGEGGDAAKAADYKARAVKHYAAAREKIKDDKKSLDALNAEMKSFGL